MRQLVAKTDLLANTRVAVYPVELVGDGAEFDDAYAVRVYRDRRRGSGTREVVDSVAGILTAESLSDTSIDGLPTIAPFANEPDAEHAANCRLSFPTVREDAMRLGSVRNGYLETTRAVPKGTPLTWCYYPRDVLRAYPTSCASPSE